MRSIEWLQRRRWRSHVLPAGAALHNSHIVDPHFSVVTHQSDFLVANDTIDTAVLHDLCPTPDLHELRVPGHIALGNAVPSAEDLGNRFQRPTESI